MFTEPFGGNLPLAVMFGIVSNTSTLIISTTYRLFLKLYYGIHLMYIGRDAIKVLFININFQL